MRSPYTFSNRFRLLVIALFVASTAAFSYIEFTSEPHFHVGEVTAVESVHFGMCREVTFADGTEIHFSGRTGVPLGWVRITCSPSGKIQDVEVMTPEEIASFGDNGHRRLER